MTTVLAFDTSQAWCAACLLVPGSVPVIRVDEMARGQAEHIMVMLEEMLAQADLAWADIGVLGVGTGPGNFTGIRISVAAARGLSMALDIPAIGVSSFEIAEGILPYPYWVSVDAPREQKYLQRFDKTTGAPFLAPAEALADLDASVINASGLRPQKRIENIARIALKRKDQAPQRPAPLYVRAPDAAPPRDSAPVILP